MNHFFNRPRMAAVVAVALAGSLAACHDSNVTNTAPIVSPFQETRLVADDATGGARTVDANLVNPWGIAFGSTGTLWVANNGTGTSTLYDTAGTTAALVVTIPGTGAKGVPTGTIFNGSTDFKILGVSPAKFLFAGEDGLITAWSAGPAAQIVADRSSTGAVYKGLAMAANGGANFLYATNFRHNAVDVFDATFAYVKSFTDSSVTAGYAPFGIQNIGGQLYVTFAKRLAPDSTDDDSAAGNGFVDVFNPDGTRVKRFASNGTLNSPWGMAIAPTGFGAFSGDILVGNFGDGRISVFDPFSGNFLGQLSDATNTPIAIEGLWGLTFGPGAQSGSLFFSAGVGSEKHGLIGTITPKP